MISELYLPSQANLGPYRFAYTGRWGEMTSMTLPTGTIARYTYWLDSPASGNCASTASAWIIPNWYDVLANYPCYKQVSYAGGTSTDEQSYFVINQGTYYSTTAYTSSVYTGPDGGVTRTYFDTCSGSNPNCYSYNAGNLAGNWLSGLPNRIDQPDGTVVTQTWARNVLYGTMVGSPLGCNGSPACTQLFPYDSQNVYIQQQTRTLGGSTATTTYTVDRNGNPLVTAETNWGGSTLRTTTFTYFNGTTDATTAPTYNEPYVYWNGGAGSLLNLVSTRRVDGPTSPSSYEQYCYDNSALPVSGNITLHARLASGTAGGTLVTCPGTGTASTSSVVVTQFAYGANGIMTASMDGRGVATQLLYNPNGLYVTEKREACNQSLTSQACTQAERRITSYTTDLNTGKPLSVTDADNGTETRTEYDSLGRPTKVTDPSGAETTYQYFDNASPRYVLITSPLDLTRSIRSVQCFDQLGRLTATVTSENGGIPSCVGGANVIQTRREYVYRYQTNTTGCGIGDAGYYECVSNPYRSTSDTTMGWTQTKHDGAGRPVEAAHVDANRQMVLSRMTYSYPGTYATIKDEAANATNTDNPGSTQTVYKDAAGRISSVTEIGQTTTYNYDGMDNLTDVYQGSQHRQFRYDSLGRLTSAYNPESGWTYYGYDYNGNPNSKTDARNLITTLVYDSLNRLTGKQYSDGTPAVTYTYCLHQTCTVAYGVGRLIQTLSNGTTVQYTQFDPNGRVVQHLQQHPQMNGGNAAQFSYVYNRAGCLTNVTYPSGRSVTTGYDNAGRAAAVSGSMGGNAKNYAGIASAGSGLNNATCTQCIQYAPHGGISQTYLSQNSGGQWAINEQRGYNGRLQPTSIANTVVSSGQTIRSLTLGYAAGQQSDGADNNGNLLSQTIFGSGLTSAVTQTYAYDGANRIARSTEGVCSPLQGFSYDTWGNGWVSSYTQSSVCSSPQSNTPVANVYDPATNRSGVNNATWDAAGRQQSIGGYGFSYDAENRMTSSTLNIRTVYQYNGDGRRVAKINCPGTSACDATTPGASTVWYVYDAAGNLATEFGQSSMASALPCTTCYMMADHLGSTRVMMDQNGTAVSGGCHDYLPFGEEIYSGVGGRATSCYPTTFKPGMLFTGKLRDGWGESQLDYFGVRYYSPLQMRFTTPDAPFADQYPEDPQSWNLYTYARNNPLRYVDPTGYAFCSYSSGDVPEGGPATTEKTCTESDGTWVYQPTDTDDPNADAPAFRFSVTKTENTGELSESGQAVVNQLAENADPSMAMIGLVAGGSAAIGATAALAPVAGQAVNELAFGPATGRLFWAGGQVAAEAAAASGTGRVISQSPVCRLFARLTSSLPYGLQRPGWAVLSRFWASGAAGTVNVFPRSPHPNSLLMRVELPVLLRNPNVFKPLQYR